MFFVYNLPAEKVHKNMFAFWKRLSVNTWKVILQAFLRRFSQFYIHKEIPEKKINGYPRSNKQ